MERSARRRHRPKASAVAVPTVTIVGISFRLQTTATSLLAVTPETFQPLSRIRDPRNDRSDFDRRPRAGHPEQIGPVVLQRAPHSPHLLYRVATEAAIVRVVHEVVRRIDRAARFLLAPLARRARGSNASAAVSQIMSPEVVTTRGLGVTTAAGEGVLEPEVVPHLVNESFSPHRSAARPTGSRPTTRQVTTIRSSAVPTRAPPLSAGKNGT